MDAGDKIWIRLADIAAVENWKDLFLTIET